MMRRSRLNQEQTIPPQYSDLIAALKKALAGAEPLDKAGGYDDDAKDMTKFIRGVLTRLVEAIRRFQ